MIEDSYHELGTKQWIDQYSYLFFASTMLEYTSLNWSQHDGPVYEMCVFVLSLTIHYENSLLLVSHPSRHASIMVSCTLPLCIFYSTLSPLRSINFSCSPALMRDQKINLNAMITMSHIMLIFLRKKTSPFHNI